MIIPMMMFAMFTLTLINLIMFIALTLSKKKIFDREKNSPFECGFSTSFFSRFPFSLHFYLISILFLIFDVEITIILPLFYLMNTTNLYIYLIMFIFFISILILGLLHEWNQNILNWSN
uniref:NADH dehydrogenase subunit 3 n=1 Tax=Gunungiella acanthoclada TaxID=3025504 RepID=UPI0024360F20|nr:NADH dehydrogenase subunit 3 [Gunungiella acanthoclada]WEU80056.1 NADH dehydrogenase subunit 3 [Gunungiella acanthoclada]